MTAGTRLTMAITAAALALAAPPARAQEASPPPPVDPPADSIGPRELQNFSIDGTVTRRADPTPATTNRPTPRAPATAPTAPRAAPANPPAPAPATSTPPTRDVAPDVAEPARPRTEVTPAPVVSERDATTPRPATPAERPALEPRSSSSGSVTVPLPPLDGRMSDGSASAFPEADSSGSHGFAAWPWLLAILALALGGLYLWRGRSRHALAGYGAEPAGHAFAAPEPAPAMPPPAPRAFVPPPPAPVPSPASLGIVSTRLRPRIEFAFTPLRCVVDGERVMVQFEVELFNNGNAPARDVLIEASMFNAGPAQDQAIGGFFEKPVGQGDRVPLIGALGRMSVRSQVAAPRANVQLFRLEGREVFVPLIAFNALYRWSGGEGQSSSAFLIGRESGGAKLAPLRSDFGARQFADLGARPLPNQVRS